MDQTGKAANPARGRLNKAMSIFPCPRSRLRIWSRETGRPSRPASACSFSILRLNLVLTRGILIAFRGGIHFYIIPPCAIGSVPSLSGHAIAYRWRLLLRVRRHTACNGCCRLRCHHGPISNAPLFSHAHYCYVVDMMTRPIQKVLEAYCWRSKYQIWRWRRTA